MDSLNSSCSDTSYKQRKQFSVERRPRMLKDYLIDELNSCSSGGFRSFPRKASNSSIRTLMSIDINDACSNTINTSSSSKLHRSRSKAPGSTGAISALQIFITAVKNIQFRPVKSPSILPRSLSRRLSKRSASKKSKNKENETRKTTITVKDIMRWKSFRDLVEEEKSAAAEDLAASPPHCTTTATTTTWSNTTTPRSSNRSSWSDSDFTSEYLPSWDGNSEESGAGKKSLPCVGEDSVDGTKATRTYVQKGQQGDEKDQQSPVSVIDFRFEEYEEESSSSFDESLAAMQRAKQKLMQKIRRFESLARLDSVNLEDWMDESITDDDDDDDDNEEEQLNTSREQGEEEGDEIEEKAWRLLNHVKEESCKDISVDQLLVDFFSEELAARKPEDITRNGFDHEVVNRAKSWINGEDRVLIRWEEQCKREAYVRAMDRVGNWNMFEEEREGLGLEFDSGLFGLLLDELLLELISG